MRTHCSMLCILSLGLVALYACSDSTDPGVGDAPLWGPVESLEVETTDRSGELLLSWNPPLEKEGAPALRHYEIVHSTLPISDALFDSLPQHQLVHQPELKRQEIRIGDLELGILHHFRIRAIDELGRAGALSEEIRRIPSRFGTLRFLPEAEHLVVQYGDELHFEVRTSDGDPFDVEFSIPPDTTAVAATLDWRVVRVGRFEIIATARADGDSVVHGWTVHSTTDEIPPWGPVRSVELDATDLAGELLLSWSPPLENAELPSLRRYLIAHSTQPVSAEDFETLPKREVEHRAGLGRYESLFRGLELGVPHYFRVQAVDELGRRGILCDELSAAPSSSSSLTYLPVGDLVNARYGDLLRFEARTSDGEPFEVEFQVPPDTTSTTETFDYRVRRLGLFTVFATVHTEPASRTHRWTVNATAGSWGPVRSLELRMTDQPGELQLSWSPPPTEAGLPPLLRYEIVDSWAPIPSADFEILPKREVEHQSGTGRYDIRFGALPLEEPHYFRIRAIDDLGRAGELTEELVGTPPADFTISGTALVLDAEYRHPTPLEGLRVIGPNAEATSDALGSFELPAHWGAGPIALELQPPLDVPSLHPIQAEVPEIIAARPSFLFLPRSTVTVLLPVETDWPFIRLLRHLSDKYIVDAEVAHWESYPVEVHVPEKILSNGVDYGAAIRLGIQKWNESVGFTVLVESSDEPKVGVVTSYDLRLYGGGLLGSVTILEPAGGKLYATVPLKLSLELGEWYASQALADRVALHELGHVLYLTHSPSHNHVLSVGVSGSSPNEVHPDEASVLRALIHTPNGTRYSWYQP